MLHEPELEDVIVVGSDDAATRLRAMGIRVRSYDGCDDALVAIAARPPTSVFVAIARGASAEATVGDPTRSSATTLGLPIFGILLRAGAGDSSGFATVVSEGALFVIPALV